MAHGVVIMIELFWFCHSHAQKHDKLDNLYHHHTYHLEFASSALFIEDRTYSGYILLWRKKVLGVGIYRGFH